MAQYITRRLLNMVITLALISIISFAIIQLPPGDYLTSYIAQLRAAGEEVNEELIESLRMQYGLGKTPVQQYFKWVWNFVQGNMGQSFIYDRPVNDLIWERLGLTFMIATASLVFTWLLALPIGIYSAVRQYSFGDYLFTFLSFIGLAVPNFMLALALMFAGFKWLGMDVGGLFSVEYESAPWSIAKFVDLLEHLWVPTVVLGTAGTAALVRIMRANLLDELRKLYVITARAKGVAEGRLIIKYPVRIALNPFISSVGWILPTLISGATITAIVLNLPTTGPMLVDALLQQDMFLAGSFIMMLSTLTVIGMLISDVMLVLADPRIRIGMANEYVADLGRPTDAAEREDARDIAYASQWRLVFIRLRRHRLAVASGIVLAALYLMAAFAPFLSPHDPTEKSLEYREAPPQRLRFVSERGVHLRPFVYPFTATTNRVSFKRDYHDDRAQPYPLRFFVRGYRYQLLFVFESDIHLFGTGVPEVPVHLLGTDHLGRDMLARVMYGAQISLSVGLVGVAISFVLGILIGGLAGYFGGFVDEAVQRVVEVLLSIPQLPLWMGLSAALPLSWPVVRMYFAITVILSLVGWTRLAREVRGKFLSLRGEDYVVAAQVAGMRDVPIIFRHMVPSFLSHIVASLTLSIPLMIIGETSLSFLGLGMQAPAISWGVLLQSAQKVQTLELAPWLMIPALYVIVTVLAFNFLGDGLRDAADPYGQT